MNIGFERVQENHHHEYLFKPEMQALRNEKIEIQRKHSLPNYCRRRGAMCQRVDSTLLPNEVKR